MFRLPCYTIVVQVGHDLEGNGNPHYLHVKAQQSFIFRDFA